MYGCNQKAEARSYTALVRPHLKTCAPVWTPHQKGAIDALERVQKRAARWISTKWDRHRFKWTKSYDECRAHLKWMTIEDRHRLLSCCQMYKLVHSLDCLTLTHYLCFNNSTTRAHPLSLNCVHPRVNCFRFIFCKCCVSVE